MTVQQLQAVGCDICGGRGYVRERDGARSVARPCACNLECPQCGDSGWRLATQQASFSARSGVKDYDVLEACSCRERKAHLARFTAAGIPGRFATADFESYRSQNEAQHRAWSEARSFADHYVPGESSTGFILSGPVGTGKTHLLCAVLAHLTLEKGVSTRYQEISFLFQDIRRGFREGKSGGEIVGPLCDVELLAIDELGKGRGSEFEMETLDELIARRYNAGKVTLFATNYSLASERKPVRALPGYVSSEEARQDSRESNLLRARVGERIFSRLFDMCSFVEMPAETKDYRVMRQELELRNLRPRRT
ncbi:MAG TPA: ATP-binding protein [Myxococcaceae bacterium]|nr:ATP-binding protein [Myxococcaceae bacterium]